MNAEIFLIFRIEDWVSWRIYLHFFHINSHYVGLCVGQAHTRHVACCVGLAHTSMLVTAKLTQLPFRCLAHAM